MQIQMKQRGNTGIFFIEDNGVHVAEMTYQLNDKNTMVINHTQVNTSLRGKGIGLDLVKSGVEFARREKLKVIPECAFAKSVFEKNKDLRDVLM